jgi:hypothetical protein
VGGVRFLAVCFCVAGTKTYITQRWKAVEGEVVGGRSTHRRFFQPLSRFPLLLGTSTDETPL